MSDSSTVAPRPTLGVWLGAGVGGRATRELVAAAGQVSWGDRMRADWRAHLGRTAGDPASARYVVALIRSRRRDARIKSRLLLMAYLATLFSLFTAFMILVAADSETTGGRIGGAVLSAVCIFSATYPVVGLYRAPAAERANRLLLEQAGIPYSGFDDLSPVELSPWLVGLSTLCLAAAFCALYDTLGHLFAHARVFGHGFTDPGLSGALAYTAVLFAGMWFFNRDKRAQPIGELGPFQPYKPYEP